MEKIKDIEMPSIDNIYNKKLNINNEYIKGGKKKKKGMIDILKKKYMNEMKSLKNQLKNYENKKQKGGSITGMTLVAVVIKLLFMTIGTVIFDYFPCVFIVSIFCVFMEYKMTLIMGQEIIGLPLAYMIFAGCCPCCWTIMRFFHTWENSNNVYTENVFEIMKHCMKPESFGLEVHEVNGNICRGSNCFLTNKECHKTLYPFVEKKK